MRDSGKHGELYNDVVRAYDEIIRAAYQSLKEAGVGGRKTDAFREAFMKGDAETESVLRGIKSKIESAGHLLCISASHADLRAFIDSERKNVSQGSKVSEITGIISGYTTALLSGLANVVPGTSEKRVAGLKVTRADALRLAGIATAIAEICDSLDPSSADDEFNMRSLPFAKSILGVLNGENPEPKEVQSLPDVVAGLINESKSIPEDAKKDSTSGYVPTGKVSVKVSDPLKIQLCYQDPDHSLDMSINGGDLLRSRGEVLEEYTGREEDRESIHALCQEYMRGEDFPKDIATGVASYMLSKGAPFGESVKVYDNIYQATKEAQGDFEKIFPMAPAS